MPTTPSFTPDAWANNDPTKPLNATRLAKLGTQYAAAMADVAADVDDDTTPIGTALKSTFGSVADVAAKASKAANLSDLASVVTARANLDVYARGEAQALDSTRVPWALGRPIALFDMTDEAPASGTAVLRNRIGVQRFEVPLIAGTFQKSTTEYGPFGLALRLDGSTGFAMNVLDDSPLDFGRYSDELTVHVWALSETAGIRSSKCAVALHTEGTTLPARVWAMYLQAPYYGGQDRFSPHIGCQDGATIIPGSPGFTYPYNKDYASVAPQQLTAEWRMYTMTWKDGVLTAYVDGIAIGKQYTEPSAPFGQGLTYLKNPLTVGRPVNRSTTNRRFSIGGACIATSGGGTTMVNMMQGFLGGFSIWDKAATAEQVMHDHLATLKRGSTLDPIFRWDFAQSNVDEQTPTGGSVGSETYTVVETAGGAKAPSSRGMKAYRTVSATDTSDLSGYPNVTLRGLNASDFDHVERGNGSTADGAAAAIIQEFPGGFNLWQLRKITFLLNNKLATDSPIRLLVKVGSAWYASETEFACASAHSSNSDWSAAESFSWDVRPLATNWRDLTITPGSAYTLAGAARSVDVPNGLITGVGIHFSAITTNQQVRVGKLRYWSR